MKDLREILFGPKEPKGPPSYVYTVGRIARALDIPQATIEAWLRRDILTEFLSEEAQSQRQFSFADVTTIVFFHELRKAGLELEFIKDRMGGIGYGFNEFLQGKTGDLVALGKGKDSYAAAEQTPVGKILQYCGPIAVVVDYRYINKRIWEVKNLMDKKGRGPDAPEK